MIKYITTYQILVIHKRVIDETGGLHGLRDAGLLEAATERPKASFGGTEFYPDLFTKAAAVFHSIAMNHSFLDGNKRTAFVSADLFLKQNGYKIKTTNKEVEKFTVSIVVKKLGVPEIAAWMKKHAVTF